MAVSMIGPKFYAWDRCGKPLAFGKLYTYQARTNTPKPTYQSEDQVVANTNPVILNGEGYANVYLDGSYKMVLKDKDDNEIWSADPVTSAQAEEWVNCMTATYVSSTSFKVGGNTTETFDIGRRVRIDNGTANYAYSTIESSSFAGSETTVVVSDPVVLTGIQEVCTSIVGLNSISDTSFDSVSSMKDKDLLPGVIAKTRGYYNSGDNGQAEYLIKTLSQSIADGDVIDEYGNHTLNNGNVAILMIDGLVSALKYGVSSTIDNNKLQLSAWFNSGKSILLPKGDYGLSEQITVTASDVTIVMDGFIVVDWEAIGAKDVVSFTGDNVKTKLKAKAKSGSYVLANKLILQTFNVYAFSGDNCCCVYGETQENPGFVISRKSDGKFDFINNYGFSVIDGLTADSTDITMFHYNDGEKGIVTGNKGYGFGHAILFGLSSNNSVVSGNNFWDCGNHCVYVSSGDKNNISNNIAVGDYTDIKARGDENSLTNNTVLGGNLTLTNRVVDVGNGYAMSSGIVEGNIVKCNRELTLPINVSARTGFDGKVRNLSVCNNVIDLENDNCSNALFVIFQELEDVIVNNNVVGGSEMTLADAIRVTSTAGIDPNECVRVSVCGNTAKSASESAIQVCSYRGRISDNSVLSVGGSGSNSGAILAFIDECVMDGNTVEATGASISGINQKAGDNNVITGNVIKTANGLNQIVQAGASNVVGNNVLL